MTACYMLNDFFFPLTLSTGISSNIQVIKNVFDIIIATNNLSSSRSLVASRKSTSLSDQALLIHCSTKNFLTIQHVSSITAFCIRIYRPGQS
jgi:hypothetical protein